jgi:ketosteroid isomerase-like protein
MTSDVDLVNAYIEATQHARITGNPEDFDAVRRYLADTIDRRLASPGSDEPWRAAHSGADAMIDRLRAGFNSGSRLTTETVNAVQAGPDVLVEQVSTIHSDDGDKVSCVAHIFTVRDDRISRIRTYRNDAGLPQLG